MPKSKQWQALNRQIRATEKARGMDREAHEALVSSVTGKDSLGDCSEADLRKIVAHLGGGFRRSGKGYVRKIWAMWGELKRLGALTADDTNAALLAFVNKQKGGRQFENVKQLDWLTYDEAGPVIEALKDWVNRCKGTA